MTARPAATSEAERAELRALIADLWGRGGVAKVSGMLGYKSSMMISRQLNGRAEVNRALLFWLRAEKRLKEVEKAQSAASPSS